MFSGKLGPVRKHEERSDRLLNVRNRIACRLEDDQFWKISKEKRIEDEKRNMYTSHMRKVSTRWRVLRQCLEKSRDKDEDNEDNLYGSHGGRPLNSYNSEIEEYIDYNQPEKKKRRKLDSMMFNGIKSGELLDTNLAIEKITDYFQDHWGVTFKEYHGRKGKKEINVFKERRMSMQVGHNDTKTGFLPSIGKGNTFLVTGDNNKHGDKHENGYSSDTEGGHRTRRGRKRKCLEKLTRKIECSRPNCSGYIGTSFLSALPEIE